MADVTVANTSPGIAGKTLACHDADGTTTGIWTFANPLALKGGVSGSQIWRLSVAGSGNLNVLADGSGGGLTLNTAGSGLFTGDISEKGRPTPLGHWIDEPFNAANFSATAPMTWTVGPAALLQNRYALVGKLLYWRFYLSWFSGANLIGGAPAPELRMTLPGGLVASGQQAQTLAYCQGITGTTVGNGLVGLASATTVVISKNDNSNFVVGATPGMIATLVFEVN